MNEEEVKERVEKYIKSFNGNALDCEAIETVLNELENADLVINEMSWQLLKEGFCSENDKKDCCKTDDCEECIKEYFYKKVRNNGIKRK